MPRFIMASRSEIHLTDYDTYTNRAIWARQRLSLPIEELDATWKHNLVVSLKLYLQCSGLFGITVDTKLIQSCDDYTFGLDYLSNERTYLPVDFAFVFQCEKTSKLLHTMMTNGIRYGYVQPLTRVTYSPQYASRAFHLQEAHLNRGRVLLDLRHPTVNIQPRVECSSSSWQLLMSDNEMLSLKLADRLVKRGAKKLALLLNKPSKCVDVQSRLWKKDGVAVKLVKDDIWNELKVSEVIRYCQKESSLESVFIVITNDKSNVNMNVEKINAIIQARNVPLRYFALVTTSKLENEQTSLLGAAGDRQILTNIKLPDVIMMKNEQIMTGPNSISITSAAQVFERAVCCEKSIIIAHVSPTRTTSLWTQVLQRAGIRKESIPEEAPDDMTLMKYNIEHSKLLTIQGYLRDVYEIFLKLEDIRRLSYKKINELEKRDFKYNYVENHGIHNYFTKVETDELHSTTEKIFLPTMFCTSLRYDEVNTSQTHLCIVPGVEGLHYRFKVLCKRLKLPALVLQPGLDHINETISQMANRFVEILLKKVGLKHKFYLLGYESGVLVALEMAAILEKTGLRGTIFCLGGCPTEIITHFKKNLSEYETNQQLQLAVLKHLYFLMTNEDPCTLDKLCKNLSWREKIDTCMDYIVGKVPHSLQYAKQWLECMYTRLALVLQYTPQPQMLRSQIISIRPQYSFDGSELFLQNYSEQNVISYQLQAPLSRLTEDLQCTSIINQHLDHDILKTFENINICETYLYNNRT